MKDIDQITLISRIETLAREKGMSPGTVYVESGAGKNFKSNLKTANPSLGKLTLIANYLNTTVDYLTGKTDTPTRPESRTEREEREELEDLEAFRALLDTLTEDELQKVLSYAEFLAGERKRDG